MKIKEISFSLYVKVSYPNYSSINIGNTLSAEIYESDDIDKCFDELREKSKEIVNKDLEIYKAGKV